MAFSMTFPFVGKVTFGLMLDLDICEYTKQVHVRQVLTKLKLMKYIHFKMDTMLVLIIVKFVVRKF